MPCRNIQEIVVAILGDIHRVLDGLVKHYLTFDASIVLGYLSWGSSVVFLAFLLVTLESAQPIAAPEPINIRSKTTVPRNLKFVGGRSMLLIRFTRSFFFTCKQNSKSIDDKEPRA